MNYDTQYLGTENDLHPFNQPDCTDELTVVGKICNGYGIGYLDTQLLLEMEEENEALHNEIYETKKFILEIAELLEAYANETENGVAILCKNRINSKYAK